MKSNFATRVLRALGVAGATALLAAPAFAQAAGPTVNKGDSAFMFVSTVIVLLMTIPGLALFYGGMVRTKNMLSMLMQVFAIVCVVAIIWVVYGYSMAFTSGGEFNSYVGGFSKLFLAGVDTTTLGGTFSHNTSIPEYAFVAFQMTFACITPALIVGAFAERMKFSALLLFTVLWVTFVYFPIAHMVWYWAGPDAFSAAVAGDDALKATTFADAGLLWSWGAIDFAGGTVVHINAGIAGLVGALILGKRVGFGKEAMPPHSLTMTMIGTSLLWVGWFGFNCGSNLEANAYAFLAMINTFVAPAAAGLAWMLAEWLFKGKPSLLGLASGVVAGLVAITPAAGFSGPMGAIVLGVVAGVVCFIFCTGIKNALGYDDSLDVFGVHAVGGIVGALATGVLVDPNLGGAGILDYTQKAGEAVALASYSPMGQLITQAWAVGLTIVWCGVISAILYKLVDFIIGLRPVEEKEREGLDISDHGERAYNY
jgi:Amt family ammonium transporter